MENSNNIKRSDLYNKIYNIVKQIPTRSVQGDSVDAPSAACELEKLFLNNVVLPDVSYCVASKMEKRKQITNNKFLNYNIIEKLINELLPLLQAKYEKTHIQGALLENGTHSQVKIDYQFDLYRAVFHLERLIKNLPNEPKTTTDNEQNLSFCKGNYYSKGICLKYTGSCTKGNCDYWQK